MRARVLALTAALLMTLSLCGCGEQKPQRAVHCDRCGKEIMVDEDSQFTEEWILFCAECAKVAEPKV